MTALGAVTPQVDRHAGMVLTEVTSLALASVAARLGREVQCRDLLARVLGADTPGVEDMVRQDPYSAFWIGPDQWMICAPIETHADLATGLKAELGEAASITEQTDAWVVFDLEGDVAPVMELLCPINMHRFKTGQATRTTIDHLGCFVTRLGAEHLQVLGPRSSASSLHHAILTAMRAAL